MLPLTIALMNVSAMFQNAFRFVRTPLLGASTVLGPRPIVSWKVTYWPGSLLACIQFMLSFNEPTPRMPRRAIKMGFETASRLSVETFEACPTFEFLR